MTATRNGSPPAVKDAARILHPGIAAAEAARVATDLLAARAKVRAATDGRALLLSEAREHAQVLAALVGYVAMFDRRS